MPRGMHNPLPASLPSECKKASQILDSFINGSFTGSPGKELPSRHLANAKGLAILTISKAGILASLRLGSGILIARLPDNTWSAPSAIATFGVGAGGQAGFELTDFVFILNDAAAVRTFSRSGSLTLGGNISLAFGPVGRNAEVSSCANIGGVAWMYSYSKTKGLFGGVSVEGGVLVENRWVNRRFYGKGVSVQEILGGGINGPEEGLGEVLGREIFRSSSGQGGTEGAEGTEGAGEGVQRGESQGGTGGSGQVGESEAIQIPEEQPGREAEGEAPETDTRAQTEAPAESQTLTETTQTPAQETIHK